MVAGGLRGLEGAQLLRVRAWAERAGPARRWGGGPCLGGRPRPGRKRRHSSLGPFLQDILKVALLVAVCRENPH